MCSFGILGGLYNPVASDFLSSFSLLNCFRVMLQYTEYHWPAPVHVLIVPVYHVCLLFPLLVRLGACSGRQGELKFAYVV